MGIYPGQETLIHPSALGGGRRRRPTPQYGAGPAYLHLASGLGRVVSSRGLVFSTIMRNTFVSEDPGIVLPLNGNLDEPLYIGQIR